MNTHRKSIAADAAPWRVVIDGSRRGQLWGRYASKAGALATVRDLRKHGLTGIRIVGPDGELALERVAS